MNPRFAGVTRHYVCDNCEERIQANPVTAMEGDALFLYCSDPCRIRHQSRHHADHLAQLRIDFTAGYQGA